MQKLLLLHCCSSRHTVGDKELIDEKPSATAPGTAPVFRTNHGLPVVLSRKPKQPNQEHEQPEERSDKDAPTPSPDSTPSASEAEALKASAARPQDQKLQNGVAVENGFSPIGGKQPPKKLDGNRIEDTANTKDKQGGPDERGSEGEVKKDEASFAQAAPVSTQMEFQTKIPDADEMVSFLTRTHDQQHGITFPPQVED